MSLFVSAILFAIFASNVVLGTLGDTQFLGDVGEMLVLFASAISFVVAILKREAAEKAKGGD